MSADHQSTWILGLQGWVVARGGVRLEGETLVLRMEHAPGTGYRCSRCGEGVLFAYDHLEPRLIRDFPWAGRPCALEVTLARVECPACHAIAVEATDWAEPYGRQTERYERYVAGLCSLMPATDVAALEGLDKTTVYRIDKKWLERREALLPAAGRAARAFRDAHGHRRDRDPQRPEVRAGVLRPGSPGGHRHDLDAQATCRLALLPPLGKGEVPGGRKRVVMRNPLKPRGVE